MTGGNGSRDYPEWMKVAAKDNSHLKGFSGDIRQFLDT